MEASSPASYHTGCAAHQIAMDFTSPLCWLRCPGTDGASAARVFSNLCKESETFAPCQHDISIYIPLAVGGIWSEMFGGEVSAFLWSEKGIELEYK